jgi:tight adherence protein C
MGGFGALTLVTFVAGCSLILLVGMLFTGRNQRLQGRLQTLAGGGKAAPSPENVARFTAAWLPKLGSPLVPTGEEDLSRLRNRLIHAGFYSRNALFVLLGVKMLLILVPLAVGLAAAFAGLVPLLKGAFYGLLGSGFGMLLPGLWLDSKKKKRQALLRRSLPDALDMVVVCLRGGLSLQGAFQRVTAELALAHPALAAEFTINQREIQLGRSTGEAMRHFADRSDLEEIRGLASVILQAEKLGASAVQALRIHAEALRLKRLQYAEELAHTAGTKMVFPTILCIFPSILIVVIGPAAFQIAELFSSMKN